MAAQILAQAGFKDIRNLTGGIMMWHRKGYPAELEKKGMTEKSNVIFIGSKPPMNYVLAVITGFSSSSTKEMILKARGRSITTCVDVAEISRNRILKDLKIGNITIGTEEMPPREGQNSSRMVSTMEITLKK